MRGLVKRSGFWTLQTTFPLFGGNMFRKMPAFPSQCNRWLGLNFKVIGPVKQKIYFSPSFTQQWENECHVQLSKQIPDFGIMLTSALGIYSQCASTQTPNPCFSFFQPGRLARWLHMCKHVLPQLLATAELPSPAHHTAPWKQPTGNSGGCYSVNPLSSCDTERLCSFCFILLPASI